MSIKLVADVRTIYGDNPVTYDLVTPPSPLPNSPLYKILPRNDKAVTLSFRVEPEDNNSEPPYCDSYRETGNIFVIKGRLSLLPQPDLERESIAAICKFCIGASSLFVPSWREPSLTREIRFYSDQLLDLQGDCVPYFYGGFQATLEDGDPILCMFLEDAGPPVSPDRFWNSAGKDEVFIEKVALQLAKVHAAGVCLADEFFDNLSVLSRSDSDGQEHFTLVGFSSALPEIYISDLELKLKKKGNIDKDRLCVGKWEPDVGEIPCGHLFESLRSLDAWIPGIHRQHYLQKMMALTYNLPTLETVGLTWGEGISATMLKDPQDVFDYVAKFAPYHYEKQIQDVQIIIDEFYVTHSERIKVCGWERRTSYVAYLGEAVSSEGDPNAG